VVSAREFHKSTRAATAIPMARATRRAAATNSASGHDGRSAAGEAVGALQTSRGGEHLREACARGEPRVAVRPEDPNNRTRALAMAIAVGSRTSGPSERRPAFWRTCGTNESVAEYHKHQERT
jgi:hypothetical protein